MQYAWLIWTLLLLLIWALLYASLKERGRREMLIVSAWTALLGLTEPLFVPAYWNPPSLFDLAQRTGFDIESVLFAFGVGGIVAVLYERLFAARHESIATPERAHRRHRLHLLALFSAPILFALLFFTTAWNPIYVAIAALTAGGFFTWYCRPDLKVKMLATAALFTGVYFAYFLSLIALFPGYVQAVWNLPALSGVLVLGVPLEELLFAASFGFFWSSIYEHFTWRKLTEA